MWYKNVSLDAVMKDLQKEKSWKALQFGNYLSLGEKKGVWKKH